MVGRLPLIGADSEFQTTGGDLVLRHTLRAWRRHKWLFAFCFFAVTAGGVAALSKLAPLYTATVSITMTPPPPDDMLSDTAAPSDPNANDLATFTAIAVMQSRQVAAAVLTQYPPPPLQPGLKDRIFEPLCQLGMATLCHKNLTGIALKETQIDRFVKNLSIIPEPRTQFIDVSVTAEDPQRAADLANAVVATYQQFAVVQQNSETKRIATWLADRTSALEQGWLDAAQQANAFAAGHHLAVSATDLTNGPLVDQQISAVSMNLTTAQSQLDDAQAQAEALRDTDANGDAASLLALPGQPVLVSAAENLIQLENTRDQLTSEFGPNYPKIEALNQQIASTQAQLNGRSGNGLPGMQENLIAARTQVQQLTAQLGALRAQSASEGAEEAKYMALSTKAASMRTAYETFLQHADDVEARVSLLESPVTVISPADPPLTPAFPNKVKLGLGIVVLAFATGASAALLRDRSSQRFGEADGLGASLQLPVLAELPVLRGKPAAIARHVLDEPHSRTSEAMRGVAAILALEAGPHTGSRTVLISSAGALEGKSTLATWLAMTARQSGQNVLLIDGDHRGGSLVADAAVKDRPGLTDLLAKNSSLDEVVQFDPATKIAFISHGTATTRAFATNDIARLRGELDKLKKTFGLIVIDSPPLLAMVDGLVWGSIADQTIFVCRWEHSSRQAVTASLERMRIYGAKVAGIVVSMVGRNATLEFNNECSRQELKLISRYYGSRGLT